LLPFSPSLSLLPFSSSSPSDAAAEDILDDSLGRSAKSATAETYDVRLEWHTVITIANVVFSPCGGGGSDQSILCKTMSNGLTQAGRIQDEDDNGDDGSNG
jgi:hypothetical protein